MISTNKHICKRTCNLRIPYSVHPSRVTEGAYHGRWRDPYCRFTVMCKNCEELGTLDLLKVQFDIVDHSLERMQQRKHSSLCDVSAENYPPQIFWLDKWPRRRTTLAGMRAKDCSSLINLSSPHLQINHQWISAFIAVKNFLKASAGVIPGTDTTKTASFSEFALSFCCTTTISGNATDSFFSPPIIGYRLLLFPLSMTVSQRE